MDPDSEWGLWRGWLGMEPRGRTIHAEVVEMLAFRKVWRTYAAIYEQAPEAARKYGLFTWWTRWNYARAMGSAIRRQVDIRNDVVSLARLIDRIWRYPTVLSRERYLSLQGKDDHGLANGWFDDLAGTGDFINPEIPAADMEYLRQKTAPVRNWVNNAVAHFGQRERGAPPLGEIHDDVDVIFDLFHKYANLILATSVVNDVAMPPWEAVFKVAWIPEGEWQDVMMEIRRIVEPPFA